MLYVKKMYPVQALVRNCFPDAASALVKRKSFNSQLIFQATMKMKASKWETWFDDDVPKITVPSKAQRFLLRQQKKKEEEAIRKRAYRGDGPLVISCKRSQFNHFCGHRYPPGQLGVKFLASQGWKHRKSAGDWMIFQPFMDLPAFEGTMKENFGELHINPDLLNTLKRMSLNKPTLIQEKAIPEVKMGHNTLIAAETGSGKTLAYLLPMIENVVKSKWTTSCVPQMNTPSGLILAPSKELVLQISSVAKQLCAGLNLRVGAVCGRSDGMKQGESVDIVVATPGALAPMARHRIFSLNKVQNVVLDEADTLMDDSFSTTVLDILHKINVSTQLGESRLGGSAQIVIVSATMPHGLENILGNLVDMNAISMIMTPQLHHVLPHVKQRFQRVKPSEKSDIVVEAIRKNVDASRATLVFCKGSNGAHHLSCRLEERRINHQVMTGRMRDSQRSGLFEAFQSGATDVLLATDLASRGLDTRRVKHVINFDFPDFISDYLHRAGRVGRVGGSSRGMVTSYISQPWEVELLWRLESSVRKSTAVESVNANIKRTLVERKHGQTFDQLDSENELIS